MHESSLSRRLLEEVLARADEAGATRVVRVQARLAETEALKVGAIEFHFRALARETKAEFAQLELELHHVRARCTACSFEYAPEHHLTLCPKCGATEASLLGETGLLIQRIVVE